MLDIILDCPTMILELPRDLDYDLELDLDNIIYELEVSDEGILPYYTGVYEITPRVYEQYMATKNHSMREDVTIHGIPKAEVSNVYGLTVTIG